MKSLVFFGSGDFAAPSLRALIEADFDVTAVVTQPDRPAGRGLKNSSNAVRELAMASGLPLLQPATKQLIAPALLPYSPGGGIVVSYGKILPADVLDLFRPFINVHASLLPKFRGPSPIESAILNAEKCTGISLMQVAEEMDTGDVYYQKEMPLSGHETRPQLFAALSKLGAQTLVSKLPAILSNTINPLPQDHKAATYCQIIKKSNGQIDWEKPAEQLEREVRAYLGWPGSSTSLGEINAVITKAHAVPSNTPGAKPGTLDIQQDLGVLMVETSKGRLCIDRLIPAGRREMTAAEFLRGYAKAL